MYERSVKTRNQNWDAAGSAVYRRNPGSVSKRPRAFSQGRDIPTVCILSVGCVLLLGFAAGQEFLQAGTNPDRLVAGRFGSTTFQSCRATPSLGPEGPPTFESKTLKPIGRFVSQMGSLHGTLQFHGDGTGIANFRHSSVQIFPIPEGPTGEPPDTENLPERGVPTGPSPEPVFPRTLDCEMLYEVGPGGRLVVDFTCEVGPLPSLIHFTDVGQVSLDRQTIVLTSIGRTIEETVDPGGAIVNQRICMRSTTAVRMGRSGSETGRCTENSDCGGSEFCRRPLGRCVGEGQCSARTEVCTTEFNPVCGCDGVTYSNACNAAGAGVSIARNGSCSLAPVE